MGEIVESFLKEAEEDYIGLWAIAGAVRWHLGLSANGDVKARTLDVVRLLLDHGLVAGDYDYGAAFHPWEGYDANATIARIDGEWDVERGDPSLPDSICWFEMKE